MIEERWQAARRILAVRLDNLGDVLVTTPAIHAIRESLPEAEVTLLASPVGAQAGRLNPDLADVIVYEAPWTDPWQQLPQDSARERRAIAALRKRRFDGAIIFTSFRQSPLPAAYLCYLADIPLRLAASIDGPGSLLTTRHRHPERMMHEVERGLDLVGAIGLRAGRSELVLRVPAEARARAAEAVIGRPLVVLHPGCSMPARTYPWELYAEVASLLVERLGAVVALTGAADERELLERVRGAMRPRALPATFAFPGTLPFDTFCALIEAADLTITNNTGPMHVSAAVKTPVVALFALTNPPEQWGPWRVPHQLLYHEVPCRLCYSRVCPRGHECLRLVTPEMVVEAARGLLGQVRVEVNGSRAWPEAAAPGAPTPPRDVVLAVPDGRRPSQATRDAGAVSASRRSRAIDDGHDALADMAGLPTLALPAPPRRIAILRALYLGDLLCATPAFRALRRRFPEAEITLIGLPWARELVERLPDLDRLETFPGYPGIVEAPYRAEQTSAFLASARAAGYDLALQMHGDGNASNGFVADLGARISLGYRREAGVPDDRLTLTLPYDPDEHEVLRWLRLVAVLGAPADDTRLACPTTPDDEARAAELLAGAGSAIGRPLVGLHPGAKEPARRWPTERFAALADALAERHGARIVLTGSDGERDVTAAVRKAMRHPALDLAGQTDLGSYAAVVARLALLVTNDTGAAHLAVATATPSVVLFGPGRPNVWGPPDRCRHRVVEAPLLLGNGADGATALRRLPVEPVLVHCEELLDGRRPVAMAARPSDLRPSTFDPEAP